MIKKIIMPSAGQTTDTAVVSQWMVAKGDKVNRGDILVEVETDKAVLPVESYAAGIVIDLLAGKGDTVDAGDVLAIIGDEKDLEAAQNEKHEPAPSSVNQVNPASIASVVSTDQEEDEYLPIIKGEKVAENTTRDVIAPKEKQSENIVAMPNAKKLARENQVDLSKVVPFNGMVIKRTDVQAFMDKLQKAAPVETGEFELFPMSKMRMTIAKRMLESVQTIPNFQVSFNVDMTQATTLKNDMSKMGDTKVTYSDIIAKAVAVASKKYPLLRARYEDQGVCIYKNTNIGLAVSIEGGLVVPVVKNINLMGIEEISKAYRTKIESAREGRLSTADMGCGSVTISNLGMYDVDHFTAIINPPESCILAVGSIELKPVWQGNEWKPVPNMKITASFDHRIIDGAYGAQITKMLKALLENPALMLY